ncbi:MAG TPA: hypothetical protein VG674_12750 [Amycolatopsis sp.]|jgi:hypothetical protein|nr:hypothetical protein [Amycolatopsis sp.]
MKTLAAAVMAVLGVTGCGAASAATGEVAQCFTDAPTCALLAPADLSA